MPQKLCVTTLAAVSGSSGLGMLALVVAPDSCKANAAKTGFLGDHGGFDRHRVALMELLCAVCKETDKKERDELRMVSKAVRAACAQEQRCAPKAPKQRAPKRAAQRAPKRAREPKFAGEPEDSAEEPKETPEMDSEAEEAEEARRAVRRREEARRAVRRRTTQREEPEFYDAPRYKSSHGRTARQLETRSASVL